MQNGNRQVTVFYGCALSLWERVGVRASSPHGVLNLDLGAQLNHAIRRDLKLVRRTQGVTLQN